MEININDKLILNDGSFYYVLSKIHFKNICYLLLICENTHQEKIVSVEENNLVEQEIETLNFEVIKRLISISKINLFNIKKD